MYCAGEFRLGSPAVNDPPHSYLAVGWHADVVGVVAAAVVRTADDGYGGGMKLMGSWVSVMCLEEKGVPDNA